MRDYRASSNRLHAHLLSRQLPMSDGVEVKDMKLTIVGAGSPLFTPKLLWDIATCGYEWLQDTTLCLHDIDAQRLDMMTAYAKRVWEVCNFTMPIASSVNRDEALADADFAIVNIGWGADADRC
ncbi:MAG TPA: hypothetical protein EYP10_13305, partial [Armatimonadetes bacterium]|nr:hypothetical protein [Armatimonadota bacterium]